MAKAPPESRARDQSIARNLWRSPGRLLRSAFPLGLPRTAGDRIRAVAGNLFLHVHASRTHPWSLKTTFTLGLGVAGFFLFVLLVVTGLPLMLYFKPTVAEAYASIQDIHYVVPAGRLLRNVHRWAAHLMIVVALLHLARVFFTRSYQAPREFNWVVGVVLLVFTFALGFTGYILPWDQLAYWAFTIGANMAGSTGELTEALGLGEGGYGGSFIRRLLLGSDDIGGEALLRAYTLHCVILPLVMGLFLAVHIWRVRKDGGLSRPPADVLERLGHPTEPVTSWPHAFRAELAVVMTVLALVLAWAYFRDAPLLEPARPTVPENPSKAPWYFLGLQELVSYSAFIGGILAPVLVLGGLALVPYLDREEGVAGLWPGQSELRWAALTALLSTGFFLLLAGVQVRYGWLRAWYPDIPQIVVIALNPGTLWLAWCALWSWFVVHRTVSTRLGAVALVTCFFTFYILLTYFAAAHRGPDWEFYPSPRGWEAADAIVTQAS